MDFLIGIDIKLPLLINSLHNGFLDILTLGIGWITEGGFIWLFFCFLIFIFNREGKKRKIILILLSLLLNSWIVDVFFKSFFFRSRPYVAIDGIKALGKIWADSSFPSGHVAASVAALVIIFYLFRIRQKWLIFSSVIFILFLGFARIYAGMHYPTDILGGIIVGLFSALPVIWLDKQVKFSDK